MPASVAYSASFTMSVAEIGPYWKAPVADVKFGASAMRSGQPVVQRDLHHQTVIISNVHFMDLGMLANVGKAH